MDVKALNTERMKTWSTMLNRAGFTAMLVIGVQDEQIMMLSQEAIPLAKIEQLLVNTLSLIEHLKPKS